MKNVTSPWTPEVFERVKKMWREGISAARIETMTGISRSAIIGKMHRKGVQTPNSQRARRPALARKPDRPRITAPKVPRPPRLFVIGNGPQSSGRKPPSLPAAAALPSEPAPLTAPRTTSAARRRIGAVEITLGNGRSLKVDEEIDPAVLARLAAALDGGKR